MDLLFTESVILVQNLRKIPNDHQLLQLYGIYKQIC